MVEELKSCLCCYKTLTPSNTLGGFMGFMCRLFGMGDTTEFKNCQNCRDAWNMGMSLEEIRKLYQAKDLRGQNGK